MIKTIIDYVNYHYQFCENIDSFLLTNNLDTNEYYIKSCLIYKYLYELYFRENITLREVMSLVDNSDFYFISNSNVLKNHLICKDLSKLPAGRKPIPKMPIWPAINYTPL